MKKRPIKASDLRRIGKAEDYRDGREPPLRIGDVVTLNSGGPTCLLVDIDGDAVTIAWRDGPHVEEATLPEACIHRINDLW